MRMSTIQTALLNLVPPSSEAEQLYEEFYTNPGASSAYGGPLTSSAARTRLAADIDSWNLNGFGIWVVQRRQQQDFVGVCGYWQGNGWPRELTWWLLPKARGAGIAREASLAAIRHAYFVFGWPIVETYMNDSNESARNLVLRLGGIKSERRQFPDGLERDVFQIPHPHDA
jgi:[ribosomal protein S5]-alanine N-acetyltransferase